MQEAVREICLLSVICAAACSLAPEGAVKSVMGILSSVILMLCVLKPLSGFDADSYAAALAGYHELEQSLSMDGEELRQRLNRLVIEEEYCAYIRDKAQYCGVELLEVGVSLSWSTDGYWVPVGIELGLADPAVKPGHFSELLEAELGVPESAQLWYVVE